MQMYDGLSVATNKITLEQRKGIPHHLLGCIRLDEEPWTVQQYRIQASNTIKDIRSRNKLPILVGGTHYYTQSLLFKDAVLDEEGYRHLDHEEEGRRWPILNASTEDMLEELQKADPAIANRWHPKERRKIRHSLAIWLKTGRKASDIYDQQRQMTLAACSKGTQPDQVPAEDFHDVESAENLCVTPSYSALSYDTLIFWTHADSTTLIPRLEQRIDAMVLDGLLSETESMVKFLKDREQQGISVDQSRGIWVAIGFKELLPYLMDGNYSESLKNEGIERIKIATRQYAKTQVKWIRLKLQRAIALANCSHRFFLLDATDLARWPQDVENTAKDITKAFLEGSIMPRPVSLSNAANEMLVVTEEAPITAIHCDACEKTLMSEEQWIKHIKSRRHKSAVRPTLHWQASYSNDNPE